MHGAQVRYLVGKQRSQIPPSEAKKKKKKPSRTNINKTDTRFDLNFQIIFKNIQDLNITYPFWKLVSQLVLTE